jgi:hypothetical protein
MIIQRTHKKSMFIRLGVSSPAAGSIFSEQQIYNETPIRVLQVMYIENPNYNMIVELVKESEFEEGENK